MFDLSQYPRNNIRLVRYYQRKPPTGWNSHVPTPFLIQSHESVLMFRRVPDEPLPNMDERELSFMLTFISMVAGGASSASDMKETFCG